MRTRDTDPEFYQALDSLKRMQHSEAIDFRLEKRDPEDVSLINFHGKIPPEVEQDIRFVRKVLGLNPTARELALTFGARPRNDQELAVLTRSMLEIFLELGGRVEVPATDIAEGSTVPVPPERPDSSPRDQPLVKIHSGTRISGKGVRHGALQRPLVLDRQWRFPLQGGVHLPAVADLARPEWRGVASPGNYRAC